MKESIKRFILIGADVFVYPCNVFFMAIWRIIRHYGLQYFPLHRSLIRNIRILPVPDHYYQPQFLYSQSFNPEKERRLTLNTDVVPQINLLNALSYDEELVELAKQTANGYCLSNGAFEEGDADLYYLMIRNHKPKRIIEVGSGHSTRLARIAIQFNQNQGSNTNLTCIEPYENKWLDNFPDIQVIRKKAEDLGADFFDQLHPGDFLFIDSSHVIRPENDVLFIYLDVLPRIRSGVIIHIHDIFTPRHYPSDWTNKEFRLWNEQYLLETLLIHSDKYDILFSLNHLFKTEIKSVQLKLKNVKRTSNPSSFWLIKK